MLPLAADTTLGLLALWPPGWGANLLRGLMSSIPTTGGAFGLGLVIGTPGAWGKLHGGPVRRDLLALNTTMVRAVPELVMILYFAVTDAVNQVLLAWGNDRIQISGLAEGIAMLGVVRGAYATEVIPGLANLWLVATKDTALLAVVGFGALTQETRQAAATTKAYFTFFMAAGGLYLTLSLLSGVIFGRIERRARRGQPGTTGAGR